MAAALDPEILVGFEGRRKIKKVNGVDELFQVIVKIGSFFCILQNDHVVVSTQFIALIKG